MAKGGIIGLGIFFFVIAVIGYIIPVNDMGWTAPEVDEMCSSALGQLGRAFSGDVQQVCTTYKYVTFGIYGSGLLGLILIIVGAVIPGSSKKNESNYICGYCKFVANSERELHNHSLDCKAYKQEINKEKHNALDILKERYAKGEINKEEFDDMKKNLED